ncbi:MAG: hypothetical protein GTO55_01565, partial [Armatimonadetes bacterium]|nr:hypothetical protein [Armatimonadota bacterium]NIM22965.1 hypothetical protein [Armatimonadota bacterium]NIM66836.1 hypothetical protein [Armatimonadota bacterium]NIM75377.1 hypothetical protein [Armatimonadota bacterium]NIN05024.1 hypothetical protein [Armatimonadota bacterium]
MKGLRVFFLIAVLIVLVAIAASAKKPYEVDIDPADFVGAVTNPYFPLTPGTTHIYEGETEDGTEHVENYVTHDTKEIMGVTCIVLESREWIDGELVEFTLDWHAQDIHGNVWYFGEYTTEYEDGEPVSHEGSWEAGVDDALPGIIMLASPRKGARYRQEYYEDVAEDWGLVLSLDGSAEVPYGSYSGLLVTKDWTPLEPGQIEHKYYASG